ncbi:hypothetical protein PAXRUDRAFT_15067 [Paxillus rubicundulus Ve08.2h10]|uniref:Phosphatidate phosphatase APP1 catalytic domain-containing protein n=1 Tax=Paxillus rubicundulus Ve08.2h10 TaxID=930991 RepID=A0A0D0DJF5_9AGAM|nr:hypothetical protein PAXRUDRAFT_15067 [Paxillus rubicundulus Ve08.2h10]
MTPPSSRLNSVKDYLIPPREFRLSLPSRRPLTPGEHGYVPGRTTPQSWGQWAGQKIKRNHELVSTVDEVNLFPGWATKRLPIPAADGHEDAFNVSLHVSGFATSRRTPELITRSQRAFLKLARGFASLPKLRPTASDSSIEYTSEPLHPPPRPDEITDDYEAQDLDEQFQNSGGSENINEMNEFPFGESVQFSSQMAPADRNIPADLQRLHANLESRLKPFWTSALSSRRVEVSVYIHSLNPQTHPQSLDPKPILRQRLPTGPDGFFSGTFTIDWKEICALPADARIALDGCIGHELLVEAQVVGVEYMSPLHQRPTNSIRLPITDSAVRVISDIDDTVKMSRIPDGARAIFHNVFVKDLEETVIPEMGEWYDKMWKRGVCFHYVSNSPFELLPVIDQFLKISNLPLGSIRLRSYAGRSLFNGLLSAPSTRKRANVIEVLDHFPGSNFILVGDSGEQDLELYASLAVERPHQIVGVFIRDVCGVGLENPTGAWLPQTNPAMTPASKGFSNCPSSSDRRFPRRASSDTEMQVLGPHRGAMRIPRPTPAKTFPPTSYSLETKSEPVSLGSLRGSVDSSSSIVSLGSSTSSSMLSGRPRLVTEGEKKRWDLQSRVNKARSVIPENIVLRVFEHPRECEEAEQIIRQHIGASKHL